MAYEKIYLAVQCGHRKLAAALIEEKEKSGYSNFGFLHRDVSFDNNLLLISDGMCYVSCTHFRLCVPCESLSSQTVPCESL